MTLEKRVFFPMVFTLLLATIMSSVKPASAAETSLSLDPAIVYATPGEAFTINLTVHSAENLYAWQANVSYDPDVLSFVNVTEGSFLDRQPEGTWGYFNFDVGYAQFGWTTQGMYVGESGSGTLATLEFDVITTGESRMKMETDAIYIESTDKWVYPTFLRTQGSPNPPPNWKDLYPPEDFVTQDALFTNTIVPPTADFSYSPAIPGIDQPITFDASPSTATAPSEIVEYLWDFGDGENASTNTPTIEHTFTEGGSFTVTLTVIDNATASELTKSVFDLTDDNMPPIWYELFSAKEEIIQVAYQNDIAVTDVTISELEVTAGETISISVTVRNGGLESESFDVTVFFDTTEIDTKQVVGLGVGEEETVTFEWDTTEMALGSYQIKATASVVEGETNTSNNEFVDGTVTVKAASESFPWTLVIGGIVGVAVVVAVIFLVLRRRGATST